jgi:hypothetical protein
MEYQLPIGYPSDSEPKEPGTTGFIQRELERLAADLREPQPPERYCALYAARQALVWAMEPGGYAAPSKVIESGAVQPLVLDNIEAPDWVMQPRAGDCS